MTSRKSSEPKQEALFDPRRLRKELPGYKKPGTSKDAAKSMKSTAETLRDAVLKELARASGTADEIAERLNVSILAIRPRLSELTDKIEATGERRPNKSGRMANVWRLRNENA